MTTEPLPSGGTGEWFHAVDYVDERGYWRRRYELAGGKPYRFRWPAQGIPTEGEDREDGLRAEHG